MQISEIGMRSKVGFTLIEILVVIFIIGILVGVVWIGFGDFGLSKRIEMAAGTFQEYLLLLEDIAIIESSMFRVNIVNGSYTTSRWDNNSWQLLPSPGIFKKQMFPRQAAIRLITKPQGNEIRIQSTGEITPFTLNFSNKNGLVIQLIGTQSGEIQVVQAKNE